MFIVPEHQGKGYGQDAMALVEDVVDAECWELETILQEEGNCYFYEKMGYRRTITRELNAIENNRSSLELRSCAPRYSLGR